MTTRFRIRASTVIAVGLCFGALAGCAGTELTRSMSNAGYGLHYVDNGDSVKLAYGEANSDNVGLMMECARNSRRVEVSDVARGGKVMILTSGGQRTALRGNVVSTDGPAIVYASAWSTNPAFAAFRATGKMDVANNGRHYSLAAKGDERANVETFFRACGV